jgi:hypothetical protein
MNININKGYIEEVNFITKTNSYPYISNISRKILNKDININKLFESKSKSKNDVNYLYK